MTNPSFKQWSPSCVSTTLPFSQRVACDRPAQPDTHRSDQRIQEHHLLCFSNDGFDECFLLFAPVIPNNPDIDNFCTAISGMPTPPLVQFKRCALKLNRPTLPSSMSHKDIGNTVWFR